MTTTTNVRDLEDAAPSVGLPMDRVDGPLKVTGRARYSAEFPTPNVAYAVIVTSTVPVGRIIAMDTAAAEAVPGVIRVMTHRNTPKLPMKEAGMITTKSLSLMQDDVVHYNGQPIALVVAESLEQAQDAASLVKVRYGGTTAPTTHKRAPRPPTHAPGPGGGGQPDPEPGHGGPGLAQAGGEG